MKHRNCMLALLGALLWGCGGPMQAQTPEAAGPAEAAPGLIARSGAATEIAAVKQTIPLVVPKGFPLQIALESEVRVQEEGQAVRGKTVRPVYAFDRVVIPAGSEVSGRILRIQDVSKKERTFSALDANFTPDHGVELEFNEVTLADGKRIAVHTVVTRGSGQVMEFVRAKGDEGKSGAKSAASEKIDEAKQEAKSSWDEAMKQVKEPGRMHRLRRYLVAQLPIHPQYLKEGALYSAELQEPLDFGTTPLTPKLAASLGRQPGSDSLVHALLVTPLSSATSRRDDEVEAMLWMPLFEGNDLVLPAGSRLKGVVLQAQSAQKMHHNGELRVAFHDLIPPDGLDKKVSTSLVGIGANKAEHVELDSEGGAQSTTPNTRYLTTALAVGLAVASSRTDSDARFGGGESGDSSTRAAGGAGGFKLIGIAVGLAVHSQPLGLAMGALGAGRAIYRDFLGRGHEVTFPKNTQMDVTISPERAAAPQKPA